MRKTILNILVGLVISSLFVFIGYGSATIIYREGFEDGVTTALDSVNAIATQQLSNQTINSKFYIQATDTLEFILSPKTIKMK